METENAKTIKKVAYLEHQRSGCLWYRIQNPMTLLEKNGIPTEKIKLDTDVDLSEFQSFQFYGAYPFSMENVLKHLKGKVKIVYDMDDALALIDETNAFYHSVKRDVGSVQQILDYADEVTVSTPLFKDFLKGKTKAKITVVPNSYYPEQWTFKRPEREGIRIGFSGSSTHVPDLIKIIPTIKKLQDKYNVKFLIMGFGQEDYRTWFKQYRYMANETAVKDLEQLDLLLSEIVFEWIPFVDFERFPDTLTNLSLDIGLCPLNNTAFNNHRSACKALEYNLAGALCLASDTIPYQSEPTSVLVGDDEWEQILTFYIENPIKREIMRATHLAWIKENRDINKQIDLLKSVYVV